MHKPPFLRFVGAALLLLSTLISPLSTYAQGTAFTYQGFLTSLGAPANGAYDLQFALFDAASGGVQQGSLVTVNDLGITNGLFTVTIDPGASVFTGADRWLELGVRTNGGGAFIVLTLRQKVTPTPYANYAYSAATLATSAGQSLNFSVNGTNVLRIASVPDQTFGVVAVNSVGGYSGNIISNGFGGSFIGGGGNSYGPNQVGADYASVVGGLGNTASGTFSTAMGNSTWASGVNSTAIGSQTAASGFTSTAMGYRTTASGHYSTAMGYFTTASGQNSTAMGASTTASGSQSTAMGAFTTASGDYSTAMGSYTSASGPRSTAMGENTLASGDRSTAMGSGSTASGAYSTAMGNGTTASSNYSTAMGYFTTASNLASTAMGAFTTAGGSQSTALGFRAKAIHQGSFVWGDATAADFASTGDNQFLIRAGGGVGIGTTSPGRLLQVGDITIPNSQGMMRFGSRSGTGGAFRSWDIGVPETDEVLSGTGYSFVIDDQQLAGTEFIIKYDTGNVGIGVTNPTSKLQVAGVISASSAVTEAFEVSGAGAGYALLDRSTGAANRWSIYGNGGSLGFYSTGNNRMILTAAGALSALSFTPTSDRNAKENFQPIKPQEVLAKVVALPISEWNFKAVPGESHIGPMAQDFKAAFGTGADDKHIATVDADGVALAAIQGLNEKLEGRSKKAEGQLEELKAENAALKKELRAIKEMLSQLSPKKD